MSASNVHLVITTGGTGGHFFPALSIAREFRQQGGQVSFVISGQQSQRYMQLAIDDDFTAKVMIAHKIPTSPLKKLFFPFEFFSSLLQARSLLKTLKPNIILGMGSYTSVPISLMAARLKIPLVLHEGNSCIGKANRLLSKKAKYLAMSLPLAAGQVCHCQQIKTGMPLREQLLQTAKKGLFPDNFFREKEFSPSRPVLLVFGGSQGANFINNLMLETSKLLTVQSNSFQVLHYTGTDNNNELIETYQNAGVSAYVANNTQQIEYSYLAADLVLCRAGASTIAELALFRKPAILIPLPTAADNHQNINADIVKTAKACMVMPQESATPEAMKNVIKNWLEDTRQWDNIGEKIGHFSNPEAAKAVTKILWRTQT